MSERWKIGLYAACMLMIVTVPPLLNSFVTDHGDEPLHATRFFADDLVYESYINQVHDGADAFVDRLTSETPQTPNVNIFWLIVGLPTRFFNLTSWQAVLIARALISLALVAALTTVAYRAFPGNGFPALVITTFVASYRSLHLLLNGAALNYVDLQDAEVAHALISPPHIMAAFALLIVLYHVFFRWTETRRDRYLIASALCGIVLLQFYPYVAPTIFFTTLVWLLLLSKSEHISWSKYLLFLGSLGLPLLYHVLLTLDPVVLGRYSQNSTPAPALWFSILLTLPVLLITAVGIRDIPKHDRYWKFLLVWLVVGIATTCIPVPMNRRFSLTLFVPLGMMATLGVRRAALWLKKFTLQQHPVMDYVVILTVLWIGGIGHLMTNMKVQMVSQYPHDVEVMRVALSNLPRGIVLANDLDSLIYVGRAGQISYASYWGETVDYDTKRALADKLLADPEHTSAQDLLKTGARYAVIDAELPCFSGFQEKIRTEHLILCERDH